MPPLIAGLEALEILARRLHPPLVSQVVAELGWPDGPLRNQLAGVDDVDWPDHLRPVRDCLVTAGTAVADAFPEVRQALRAPNGVLEIYRALRAWSFACETVYPLAPVLLPISRYFVEPDKRSDLGLLGRLSSGGIGYSETTGLLHGGGDPGIRGGFSVYVPETYDASTPLPLVMALHGGGGNGRHFLWSWVRAARSHGAILVAPTSQGDTWSLNNPDVDGPRLFEIYAAIADGWSIDPDRLLLTGISDGGTFSYLAGYHSASPFTHIAPVAASFHPILLTLADPERVRRVPLHLVHGVLDWMFPIAMAREADASLRTAGADVTYREIEDLSHTYPREVNPVLLEWMNTTAAG